MGAHGPRYMWGARSHHIEGSEWGGCVWFISGRGEVWVAGGWEEGSGKRGGGSRVRDSLRQGSWEDEIAGAVVGEERLILIPFNFQEARRHRRLGWGGATAAAVWCAKVNGIWRYEIADTKTKTKTRSRTQETWCT